MTSSGGDDRHGGVAYLANRPLTVLRQAFDEDGRVRNFFSGWPSPPHERSTGFPVQIVSTQPVEYKVDGRR